MIRVLRFDCARTRQVVPTLSDADLRRALAAVHRLSDEAIAGRYALAEGADEQLLGIALTIRREAERRWDPSQTRA